jgi:ribosomal protein S10
MLKLTPAEEKIHARTLSRALSQRRNEVGLLMDLQEIESSGLYKKFQHASLYNYAQTELRMTPAVSHMFISVSRRAKAFSFLLKAIQGDRLTVSVAQKIAAALTKENVQELVEFAICHTCREIEAKVRGINPLASKKDRAKVLSSSEVRLEVTVSKEAYQKLLRVQSLESTRTRSPVSLGDALEAAVQTHVLNRDPVEKAQRANAKSLKKASVAKAKFSRENTWDDTVVSVPKNNSQFSTQSHSDKSSTTATPKPSSKSLRDLTVRHPRRKPLSKKEKHAVYTTTQGRCMHVGLDGKRCTSDRWVEIHHLRHVSQGGGNEIENLTLLCSTHHDLTHQLSLAIEGQFNWLNTSATDFVKRE